jgi:hypothetical protein
VFGDGRDRKKEKSQENLPTALAGAVLLGLLGVGVDMAGLGEVAGEMLGGQGGAVSKAGMVTIIVLVRLAHCHKQGQHVRIMIYGAPGRSVMMNWGYRDAVNPCGGQWWKSCPGRGRAASARIRGG